MIFSNVLSTLLFFVLAGVTFARPAPRFLELNRRAAPTDGVFVPHPRPGKPINLPPSSTTVVFEPTKTPIKIKIIKNPKIGKIPNPKAGNK